MYIPILIQQDEFGRILLFALKPENTKSTFATLSCLANFTALCGCASPDLRFFGADDGDDALGAASAMLQVTKALHNHCNKSVKSIMPHGYPVCFAAVAQHVLSRIVGKDDLVSINTDQTISNDVREWFTQATTSL